jgi:hypothetical protein
LEPLKKNDCGPPEGKEQLGHKVFDNLVYAGVYQNMRRKDVTYPNQITKVSKSGKKNTPSMLSPNGGFILCTLKLKEAWK